MPFMYMSSSNANGPHPVQDMSASSRVCFSHRSMKALLPLDQLQTVIGSTISGKVGRTDEQSQSDSLFHTYELGSLEHLVVRDKNYKVA